MPSQFKIGLNSFKALVERDEKGDFKYHFVDKTLFIREFLNNQSPVLMLPRPRRFGKSTNLDMLKRFFSLNEASVNKDLFAGLAVATAKLPNNQDCMDYQGRYPVVHLTFKDLKQGSFEALFKALKDIVAQLYEKCDYLLQSEKLIPIKKERIQNFITSTADNDDYERALSFLIACLQLHHNEKVIVLIDEYDVPFQNAIHLRDYAQTVQNQQLGEQYLGKVQDFFRGFLGSALKDNEQLEKCLMTGVVRIAGAGVFSDLNNMRVYTILDEPFQDSFGFTEEELTKLLTQLNKQEQKNDYAKWYNGYQFGTKIIYNPWSVMCSLADSKLKAYWLETSDNHLIHSMLLHPKTIQDAREINSTIAKLIAGEAVEKNLQSGMIFASRTETLEHLWILLLSAGYLKAKNTKQMLDSNSLVCAIAIPNLEVSGMYRTIFLDWLQQKTGVRDSSPLIEYLLAGEAELYSGKMLAASRVVQIGVILILVRHRPECERF